MKTFPVGLATMVASFLASLVIYVVVCAEPVAHPITHETAELVSAQGLTMSMVDPVQEATAFFRPAALRRLCEEYYEERKQYSSTPPREEYVRMCLELQRRH
ncbi:MAG TPA: hypothetical protein VEB18_03535 [Candidatus Paceibacterota bacterium]|nr:hypothetical protein [Candidatus Paceibacterota bacterium]